MDIASTILGFEIGIISTLVAEYFRQRLVTRSAEQAERRILSNQALEKAYWPAVSALDEMLDTFPNHQAAGQHLKNILKKRGYLFDTASESNLWVVVSSEATLDDISKVRDLVYEATDQKKKELSA